MDQLWPFIPVMQFTERLFSIILLLKNANIFLNVSCEICLKTFRKGQVSYQPRWCNPELTVQPVPQNDRNGLSFHQECVLEINVNMDINIWKCVT